MTSQIKKDWFVLGGIWCAAITAIIGSWAGWTGLAEQAGWDLVGHVHYFWGGGIDLHLSWIFGIGVDWFALSAGRIWLVAHWATAKTRRAARNWTIVATCMGIAGNALHLVLKALEVPPWIGVVIIVGSLPPFMACVAVHLAVRYMDDRRQALAGGAIDLPTREPLVVRALGAARLVRNSVREFREEVLPAAQEDAGGGSPALPAAPRAKHRLVSLRGGESTSAKMREYYLTQRMAGWPDTDGRPLNGADLDRKFGGKSLGRYVIHQINDNPQELSS